jgi:hypothetical protein
MYRRAISARVSLPSSRRFVASRRCSGVSFGFRPSFTPRRFARSRPSPVRARIRSRSNSANQPSTVSIKLPRDVVVSAHASPRERERNPAFFFSVIAASVFNRSRVEREPGHHHPSPWPSWARARRSCAQTVLSPLATLRNTFDAPAARSRRACESALWPSLDTRAYP